MSTVAAVIFTLRLALVAPTTVLLDYSVALTVDAWKLANDALDVETLSTLALEYKLSSMFEMFRTLSALMKFEIVPSMADQVLDVLNVMRALVLFVTVHALTLIEVIEQVGVVVVRKEIPVGRLMIR